MRYVTCLGFVSQCRSSLRCFGVPVSKVSEMFIGICDQRIRSMKYEIVCVSLCEFPELFASV